MREKKYTGINILIASIHGTPVPRSTKNLCCGFFLRDLGSIYPLDLVVPPMSCRQPLRTVKNLASLFWSPLSDTSRITTSRAHMI